mmetsp:Transcript_88309/g.285204  ORF Transcript_88309/g.285204 Transcript_88309/m.285204 type:complete len:249 (+) Transcript_88309:1045-1791(+)
MPGVSVHEELAVRGARLVTGASRSTSEPPHQQRGLEGEARAAELLQRGPVRRRRLRGPELRAEPQIHLRRGTGAPPHTILQTRRALVLAVPLREEAEPLGAEAPRLEKRLVDGAESLVRWPLARERQQLPHENEANAAMQCTHARNVCADDCIVQPRVVPIEQGHPLPREVPVNILEKLRHGSAGLTEGIPEVARLVRTHAGEDHQVKFPIPDPLRNVGAVQVGPSRELEAQGVALAPQVALNVLLLG